MLKHPTSEQQLQQIASVVWFIIVRCARKAPSPSLVFLLSTTSKTGYSSPFFGESEWSDDYRPIGWLKI